MNKLFKTTLLALVFFLNCPCPAFAQNAVANHDVEAVVKSYTAAWLEHDAAKRRKLLTRVWSVNASYTDPQVHLKGRQALSDHIGRVLRVFPQNASIELSNLDRHHHVFRYAWRIVTREGAVFEGTNFGELDDMGRIRRMVGFYGTLAPKADAK